MQFEYRPVAPENFTFVYLFIFLELQLFFKKKSLMRIFCDSKKGVFECFVSLIQFVQKDRPAKIYNKVNSPLYRRHFCTSLFRIQLSTDAMFRKH